MKPLKPILALAAFLLLPGLASAQSPDPWQVLQGVRQSLASAGPSTADFTQVYVPAGFTSGESEAGTLSLSLPDCLRWDYRNPYPKSFLLCGGVAYFWNPEDKTGRRSPIDRQNEPGLDLLLLGVEDLKTRYRASARSDGGRIEVTLTPKGKRVEQLANARLVVNAATQRLVEISYRDQEGNSTRFEIKGYKPLQRRGQFSPPEGIRWEG